MPSIAAKIPQRITTKATVIADRQQPSSIRKQIKPASTVSAKSAADAARRKIIMSNRASEAARMVREACAAKKAAEAAKNAAAQRRARNRNGSKNRASYYGRRNSKRVATNKPQAKPKGATKKYPRKQQQQQGQAHGKQRPLKTPPLRPLTCLQYNTRAPDIKQFVYPNAGKKFPCSVLLVSNLPPGAVSGELERYIRTHHIPSSADRFRIEVLSEFDVFLSFPTARLAKDCFLSMTRNATTPKRVCRPPFRSGVSLYVRVPFLVYDVRKAIDESSSSLSQSSKSRTTKEKHSRSESARGSDASPKASSTAVAVSRLNTVPHSHSVPARPTNSSATTVEHGDRPAVSPSPVGSSSSQTQGTDDDRQSSRRKSHHITQPSAAPGSSRTDSDDTSRNVSVQPDEHGSCPQHNERISPPLPSFEHRLDDSHNDDDGNSDNVHHAEHPAPSSSKPLPTPRYEGRSGQDHNRKRKPDDSPPVPVSLSRSAQQGRHEYATRTGDLDMSSMAQSAASELNVRLEELELRLLDERARHKYELEHQARRHWDALQKQEADFREDLRKQSQRHKEDVDRQKTRYERELQILTQKHAEALQTLRNQQHNMTQQYDVDRRRLRELEESNMTLQREVEGYREKVKQLGSERTILQDDLHEARSLLDLQDGFMSASR